MDVIRLNADVPGISPYVLALRHLLQTGGGKTMGRSRCGRLRLEILAADDSVWLIVRRPGQGGLAIRAAYAPGLIACEMQKRHLGEAFRIKIVSPLGRHVVSIAMRANALEQLRLTVRFTPDAPLLVPFLPRDLYPLDADDDPVGAKGVVEAGQRGLNAGLLYFHLDDPGFGSVLYFQNLTAMNEYYRATGTKPDGAVGGLWPELGYLPPSPPNSGTPPSDALAAGKEVTLSDAILVFRHDLPPDERDSARRFLQMLGAAYQAIELPPVEYRDWVGRAEQTGRDLANAPEATIRHYGHLYIHPYTDAEYPDIMVQMSVIAALHRWGRWRGDADPLEARLKAGLERFYDPKLKTLRRYLPNVGKDKNANAVDSWYLYHPLLNLGLLALGGDDQARDLFLRSIDYAIRAAQHFAYKWPILYDMTDFSVIQQDAPADGRGQTDVGGIYAWVMLQAFELTDDKRFLDEARAAIDAAIGLQFNINYQANLTAWGAAACMRLWRITNADVYREQSYVYLGSFFQNCILWESDLNHAAHYQTFLGASCLQDAPYMALYECFDSFTAYSHYMDDSGPDLEPAARMLITQYCRYALSRAWFYFPDALPPEVIAEKPRETNGHIDRTLSFPLEDLYPDGQPAGQVGQEIYGAGAAFIFASTAFHHVDGAPFLLYCDHFIRAQERIGDHALSVTLDGGDLCAASLSLIRKKRRKLPKTRLTTVGGDVLRPRAITNDRIDYIVPANGRVTLNWD